MRVLAVWYQFHLSQLEEQGTAGQSLNYDAMVRVLSAAGKVANVSRATRGGTSLQL